MTDYDEFICLSFSTSHEEQELLLAALLDIPFEGFETSSDQLDAYIAGLHWTDEIRTKVSDAISSIDSGMNWTISEIQNKNWVALWENEFHAVQAGKYYVHPSWIEKTNMVTGSVPIAIDPRMSFGTGHHESTRLALRHLSEEFPISGAVLDVGTGTGVLAIAAALSGASTVVAVDNDTWSISNATDNVLVNGVLDRIELRLGSLETVVGETFSVVVANINKTVLLRMIPALRASVLPASKIILAGLIYSDEDEILSCLSESGFEKRAVLTEGDWWSIKAEPVV